MEQYNFILVLFILTSTQNLVGVKGYVRNCIENVHRLNLKHWIIAEFCKLNIQCQILYKLFKSWILKNIYYFHFRFSVNIFPRGLQCL